MQPDFFPEMLPQPEPVRSRTAYPPRDFHLEQLAEKLQHKLGTKVSIQDRGKKGRIFIDYYSLDDLDRLLALFEIEG